jgi:hypothetical protein
MHVHVLELLNIRVLVWVEFLAEVLVCLLNLAICGILLEAEKLQYIVSVNVSCVESGDCMILTGTNLVVVLCS